MHYTPFVTGLALLLFFTLTALVGRARGKYNVSAPATTGNPDFERVFRVQQNTLEGMMLFLPALWIFAWTISDAWAAGLGLVWIAGRLMYATGYYREANARGAGFIVSTVVSGILILGGIGKTGWTLLAG